MWLWFFSGIADTIAAWILSMLGVYLLIRGSWAVILFWCPSRSPVTIWGTSLRTTHCFHICSSSTPLWNWSTSFWPQISWRSIEQWLGIQDFQQIRGRGGEFRTGYFQQLIDVRIQPLIGVWSLLVPCPISRSTMIMRMIDESKIDLDSDNDNDWWSW